MTQEIEPVCGARIHDLEPQTKQWRASDREQLEVETKLDPRSPSKLPGVLVLAGAAAVVASPLPPWREATPPLVGRPGLNGWCLAGFAVVWGGGIVGLVHPGSYASPTLAASPSFPELTLVGGLLMIVVGGWIAFRSAARAAMLGALGRKRSRRP